MSSTSLKPHLRTSTALLRRTLPTPPTLYRTATLLRRPKRPHQFDQLIILTDGSAFKQLTTSPRGVCRTTKDTRNHALWNASDRAITGMEEDEAGKLRAFRNRYGHGFDVVDAGELKDDERSAKDGKGGEGASGDGGMMDIYSYTAGKEDFKGGKKG